MWTLQFTPQELKLLEQALAYFRLNVLERRSLSLLEMERLEKLIEQISDAAHAAHK